MNGLVGMIEILGIVRCFFIILGIIETLWFNRCCRSIRIITLNKGGSKR